MHLAHARAPDRAADRIEQIHEGVGRRAGHLVRLTHALGRAQRADEAFRDLLHRDRLEPVATVAQHRHHGQPLDGAPQHGHEGVAASEDDGRPEDGPLEIARAHRLLRFPLRPVVSRAGVRPRAQRAHLSKALDAGRARELEHVAGGLEVQALEGDTAPALLADDADQVHERAAALHARGEPVGLQEKTLRKKCADDRLADEAGTAGHEHALRHGRIVARAGAPRFSLRRRAGEPVS